MKPLVSAIIPVFNRPALLRECVASVLAQDYESFEVILVDDGSDDDTPYVIADLARDSRIRGLTTSRVGPALAREAGRLAARGDYIQYLDSDDLLYRRKFSLQVQILEKYPESDVAYCRTVYRMPDGEVRDRFPGKRTHECIDRMWPSFLVSRWWSTLTPLYRRSVCDRVGPWSELQQDEDWEYDSRIATAGGRLRFVDHVLCEFRHHDGPRMSNDPATVSRRLSHRAEARRLIFDSASKAGITSEQPEMQHFSRSTFLLARQCGAGGLTAESRMLYRLSREAAGKRAQRDHRLYGVLARTIGWKSAGVMASWRDQWRA